jgi:hypothetical protein
MRHIGLVLVSDEELGIYTLIQFFCGLALYCINNKLCKSQIAVDQRLCMYSLRIGFRSRLGQRYGLQNITLTSCFYKKIFIEK